MAGGEVRVELLTSRVKGKARAAVLGGPGLGRGGRRGGDPCPLDRGGRVRIARRAVVIDEQHRFGVEQRATLRAKGTDGDPDLLVMTATPIPRTAAMVIFGDLDLTTLDEMPPGRRPVTTGGCPPTRRARTDRPGPGAPTRWRPVTGVRGVPAGRRLAAGRGRSATEEYGGWRRGSWRASASGSCTARCPLAPRGGHGRFRSGELRVLVATTVIEVGVDVPEATVMVVEERGPLRDRPAASAAGPGRPRRHRELVLPPRR